MNEKIRELKRSIRHEAKELGVTAKLIQESGELIANLSDFGHTTQSIEANPFQHTLKAIAQ
jgi:hypothetical protein